MSVQVDGSDHSGWDVSCSHHQFTLSGVEKAIGFVCIVTMAQPIHSF